MSGFILNRFAPFKPFQTVKASWRFKVQGLRVQRNFHVLRLLEAWKDSQDKVAAMQFDNIGEEQRRFRETVLGQILDFEIHSDCESNLTCQAFSF